MTPKLELQKACEAIALLEMRGKITREERNARLVALWNSPAAVGLSTKEREAIVNKGIRRVMEILDEVRFSESGRWQ